MPREESRHDFAFLAGVVVGAIGGALATLALAPMPGNEMQQKLRDQVANFNVANFNMEEMKSRAATSASSARERAASGLASASPRAQGVLSGAQATATDLVNRSPIPVTIEANGVTMTAEETLDVADMDDAGEEIVTEVTEQISAAVDEEIPEDKTGDQA